MFNLRYHVASLIAVFLALAVGLVLGTVVAEEGTITDQGAQLVSDLQKQFEDLRRDNADLREGLELDRAFAQDVVPLLIEERLASQTIIVLANAGRVDGLNATVTTIEEAGGIPVVVTLEQRGFGLSALADEHRTAVLDALAFWGIDGDVADDAGRLSAAVADTLANEWQQAGQRPLTDALVQAQVVGLSTETFGPARGVVVMAAWADAADPVAVGIGAAFSDDDLPVVAVETSGRETGVVTAATQLGYSAVDDIGTPQGEVSLVWILSGETRGYFGVRPEAEAPYPQMRTAE
ncbi:MAG: copper transporter [Anaerosomatales bacterium]|nr:copper transporter [Anaerosomatales bacterium]